MRRNCDASGFIGHGPWPAHAAELFGDRESRLQSVLVKAEPEIGAAEPDIADAL